MLFTRHLREQKAKSHTGAICKSPQRVGIEDIERALTTKDEKKLNFFKWVKDLNGHITEDIGMVNKYKMLSILSCYETTVRYPFTTTRMVSS